MKPEESRIVPFPVKRTDAPDSSIAANAEVESSDQDLIEQEIEPLLVELLMSEGGETYGLTAEEYIHRGTIRRAEEQPGKFLVTVTSKRSMAISVKALGLPVLANKGYSQEFIFDPLTRRLSYHGLFQNRYALDVCALALELMDDFRPHIERRPGCMLRKVEMSNISWSEDASNLEEARVALERRIRQLNHEHLFESLEMGRAERNALCQQLEDACVDVSIARLDKAWSALDVSDGEENRREVT